MKKAYLQKGSGTLGIKDGRRYEAKRSNRGGQEGSQEEWIKVRNEGKSRAGRGQVGIIGLEKSKEERLKRGRKK